MNKAIMARPRLVDVAKLAGVSLGSASRALNNPDSVKPKTRDAVRAAAEQLAYVPDGSARSLALRRSHTIGAVLPTMNNPVYADFVHALQQGLSRQGYSLICSAHEYDQKEEALLVERLLQRGVDGMVLVGTDHDETILAKMQRANVPYIFTWSTDEVVRGECVGFSNRRAMQQLTRHLVDLGHRDIAVLSGELARNERARARLAGIIDVLGLAGFELPPENVIYCPFTIDAGRSGLRQALKSKSRPTALMCTTDLLAAGVLAEAVVLGISVPSELSVTGFDDIAYAQLLTPPLTTVHVPTSELGHRTADAILGEVTGKPVSLTEMVAPLVLRASTTEPSAR
jgi:LacI family transcriptional regulator